MIPDFKDYKFLGWINGGLTNSEPLEECKKKEHTLYRDMHPRGIRNTYWCEQCKIYYYSDSSD